MELERDGGTGGFSLLIQMSPLVLQQTPFEKTETNWTRVSNNNKKESVGVYEGDPYFENSRKGPFPER